MKFLKIVLVLLVSCGFTVAFAQNTPKCSKYQMCRIIPSKLNKTKFSQHAVKKQHQPSVQLNTDQPSVTFTLVSNPTTGYIWQALSHDNNLVNITHHFVRSRNNLIGAPGKDVWIITATQQALRNPIPQYTKVVLVYNRPWMKKQEPENMKVINIKIN